MPARARAIAEHRAHGAGEVRPRVDRARGRHSEERRVGQLLPQHLRDARDGNGRITGSAAAPAAPSSGQSLLRQDRSSSGWPSRRHATRFDPSDVSVANAHARACGKCHAALVRALQLSINGMSTVDHPLSPLSPLSPRSQAPLDTLAAGTAVGRYTVLGLVGRGGMGQVYSAYDPQLDRRVALKLLHAEAPGDARAQDRLLREAQAIATPVPRERRRRSRRRDRSASASSSPWSSSTARRSRRWSERRDARLEGDPARLRSGGAGPGRRPPRRARPPRLQAAERDGRGRSGVVRVMDFGLARRIERLARGW